MNMLMRILLEKHRSFAFGLKEELDPFIWLGLDAFSLCWNDHSHRSYKSLDETEFMLYWDFDNLFLK